MIQVAIPDRSRRRGRAGIGVVSARRLRKGPLARQQGHSRRLDPDGGRSGMAPARGPTTIPSRRPTVERRLGRGPLVASVSRETHLRLVTRGREVWRLGVTRASAVNSCAQIPPVQKHSIRMLVRNARIISPLFACFVSGYHPGGHPATASAALHKCFEPAQPFYDVLCAAGVRKPQRCAPPLRIKVKTGGYCNARFFKDFRRKAQAIGCVV